MSTNDIEGGGSGGGDFGGTDGSGGSDAGRLQAIAEAVVLAIVPGWVIAFRTWDQFTAFLEAFVIETVNKWIVNSFVRPIVDAVLAVFSLVIDTMLLIAFGSDLRLGGSPGIADLAIWVAEAFVDATQGPTNELVGVIESVNVAIEGVAANAGLAAPIIVAAAWLALLSVVGYIAWSVIRIIDIPFVDLDAIILRVSWPFRFVLRRLT